MRVRPSTVVLEDEHRAHIARYYDALNGSPWTKEDGEPWDDDDTPQRLADYGECREYVDNLVDGYTDSYELRDSANEQEGMI